MGTIFSFLFVFRLIANAQKRYIRGRLTVKEKHAEHFAAAISVDVLNFPRHNEEFARNQTNPKGGATKECW